MVGLGDAGLTVTDEVEYGEEAADEDDWVSDEDSDAELEDIANLELEFPLEDAQKAGKQEYLHRCAELGIVPIALFIAKMEAEHIVSVRIGQQGCALVLNRPPVRSVYSHACAYRLLPLPCARACLVVRAEP